MQTAGPFAEEGIILLKIQGKKNRRPQFSPFPGYPPYLSIYPQNSMAGILYSLGAAFFWSIAVILFRKSGDTMSPVSLNLFKCLIALALLVPTLVVLGIPFFPECPASDWWILALSGIVGVTVADLFFFASLSRLGASLSAVVGCLYLPTVILLSYLFLDERLGPNGLIGGAFVLAALIVSSLHGKGAAVGKRDFVIGLMLGFLGILGLVVGILLVKEILNRSDVAWATTIRLFFAFLGMMVLMAFHPQRRRFWKEMMPSDSWRWAVPASITGNYFALLCWLAGMKYTFVSLAAILNQLSTIMIFILAALFLGERITVNRSISIALAVVGAVVAVYN